jgi:tetratricopeptide (TPR) repeat protein
VQCLSARRRVLGSDHPDTLTSIYSLGGLYQTQGKYDAAEPLYEQCLNARRRVLGSDHPNTLTSIYSLGGLYQAQGKYDAAEPLYVQCLNAWRRVLGSEHPNTLTSICALGGLYLAQGKYDAAEPLYEQCLNARRRVLGSDHPDTLTSIYSLGGLYQAQGKYDAAEPLYEQCLEAERRVLGSDHPNTGDRCKRFPFKLKFLRALEAAASIEKARGKQVILAGDFNIAARTCDVTRYYRLISMHALIQDNHFEVDMDAFNNIYRTNTNISTIGTTTNHIVEHNYDYANYLKCNHLTPYPLVHNKHTNTYFAPAMDRYLTATEVSELRDAVLYMRTVWPTVERALQNSVRNEEEGGKWRVVADRPVDGKPVRVCACVCLRVCVFVFVHVFILT